jgi:hypothetical protein
VIKNAAVANRMNAEGICVRHSSSSARSDEASRLAGAAAGDRASLGRPVEGANSTLRIT